MSEQSYTHVSLAELKRQFALRLGFQSHGDAANQLSELYVAQLQAAALWATQKTNWNHARQFVDVKLETEQGELRLPRWCGPGNLIRISVWNPCWSATRDTWCDLTRHFIGNHHDIDILFEQSASDNPQNSPYPGQPSTSPPESYMDPDPASYSSAIYPPDGDADPQTVDNKFHSRLGAPFWWQVRDRILIRPFADQVYDIKILFSVTPPLTCDQDTTVLDSEMIILKAMANYYRLTRDLGSAQSYDSMAEERMQDMRAEQQTREILPYMAGWILGADPTETTPEDRFHLNLQPQPVDNPYAQYVVGNDRGP